MTTKLLDWNLKRKIILHVLVIGGLTASILTLIYIKTQQNFIDTMSQDKAEIVGIAIENSLLPAMQSNNPEVIKPLLKKIASSRDIKELRILDAEGKIILSSNEDDIGEYLDTKELKQLNSFISNNKKSAAIIDRPLSTIQGFHLIENRPECFGCHDKRNKLIGILHVDVDYSMSERLFKKSQYFGIALGFLALATLTFIIYRLFQKIISRPLNQLKDEMRKVQNGNLGVQLIPHKKDEIGELTKSFNIMVANLRAANRQILDLHKQQMEKAGHLALIGELSAGLAHEIKNPIAGIKGAVEIINNRTDPNDPIKEIFEEILFQTDKIHTVIQDLLTYAKPKKLNIKPTNPNSPIQKALNLAQPQVQNKEINFHFHGLDNNYQISLDEDKIQEVVLNLLLNSITAIKEKGDISITADLNENQHLEITIADNGAGIKPEYLSEIFNPFYTTRKTGTGLGLSICEQIIEAHGGDIGVKSEEGKGTEFVITLPNKSID